MASDLVTPEIRSRMMAGIKGQNTRPELVIRSALHRRGFRFRIHYRNLPGKPDLVLPKHRAVILIHGCFWHGHDCHLFKWPKTREEFWRKKIMSNMARDRNQFSALREAGWRVATIWECALKGRYRSSVDSVVDDCEAWLLSDQEELCLKGSELPLIK